LPKYHTLVTPLFYWALFIPESFEDLQTITRSVSNRFSYPLYTLRRKPAVNARQKEAKRFIAKFKLYGEKNKSSLLERKFSRDCILSHPLPYLKHETGRLRDITSLIRTRFPKQCAEYDVTEVGITKYAFEIIANRPNIPEPIVKLFIKGVEKDLFQNERIHFHYGMKFEGDPNPDWKPDPFVISLVKIITCESKEEAQEIVKEQDMKQITPELFIGDDNHDNIFSFLGDLWRELYLPNLIVCVDPREMKEYKSREQLGYALSLVHSLSKSYVIIDSLTDVIGSLEYQSWFIEEIRMNFENDFNRVSRLLRNLSSSVIREKERMMRPVRTMISFSQNKEISQIIFDLWGASNLDFIGNLTSVMEAGNRYDEFELEINIDDFRKQLIELMDNRLRNLEIVLKKYSDEFNSWIQLYNSSITQTRLLFAVISTIVLFLFERIFL